ncbi:MAG: WecB/TagA/CpsF family glycosyltransferase [Selenomonadaceae bacterium]|nr:WecB/TagA/CpsF family glycosyltransferase [Selenomonadaceae bacterium]
MEKADILGVKVDIVTMDEAVAASCSIIEEREPKMIVTANAEMILRATEDAELKSILNSAALVVPDGAGAVWAANTLGYEMKERVAGYDLAQNIMAIAPKLGLKLYFFGSAPGVAEKAKIKAESLYEGIEIVGVHDGFFDEEEEKRIIEDIREKKPDVLFACLGVPKQEKWLFERQSETGVPLAMGLGGTFDVMAGVMKRAPLWMQKAKLEWLFRGMMQPSRIGRLMALPKFAIEVLKSKK